MSTEANLVDISKLEPKHQEVILRLISVLTPTETVERDPGLPHPTEPWSVVVGVIPDEEGPVGEPREWVRTPEGTWLTMLNEQSVGHARENLLVKSILRVGLEEHLPI